MTAPRPAPGTDATAGFTVLTTADGKRLAKVIRQEGDGPVEIVDFDKAFLFEAKPESVLTTRDLYRRLAELQDDPHSCIVRGAPIEGTDLSKMRRLAHEKADAAATLIDVEREIGFFDLDLEMTEEEAAKYQIVADPDAAVDFALELGPAALREADLVYSFGASAGIKPRKLSLHFAAFLDRRVLGADLKAVVEKWNADAGRTLFDSSIYGPQSIFYTARPRFEGDAIDPLEDCRIGMRNGTGRPLALPRLGDAPPPAPTPGEPVDGEAPEGVALALVSELCGRAWGEMVLGKKTRQEIAVGVFTQLRDCRVRPELAHGAARALHRAANDPDVLRAHSGTRKPFSWFVELEESIYGTAPREPRPDVADAIRDAAEGSRWPYRSTAEVLYGLKSASVKRIRTGIPTLDRVTRGGVPTGRLVVVVGRPGSGKTGVALSIAGEWSLRGDVIVVTYLADEGLEAGVIRLAQRHGGDRDLLEHGDPVEVDKAATAAPSAESVIHLDPDDPRASLDLLFETIDELAAGRTVVLVVDSAQVVRTGKPTKPGDIRLTVKDVADRMKAELRRRHGIGFLVSQQSRSGYRSKRVEERADPLATAAESSALEYMADLYLALDPTEDDGSKVFIAKSRIGGRGTTFHLALDRARSVYREVDAAALHDEEAARQDEETRKRVTADAEKVAALLKKNPEGLTATAIRGGTKWNAARTHAALEELERLDRIFGEASERRGGGWKWRFAVTPRQAGDADES